LNIRIPSEAVKNFDIDFNMTTVLLGTKCGKLCLFDLPKALENERILARRRLEIGVEDKLVYSYLEKMNEDYALD
jgi:predicted RNA binding protein with dsRBD fold (UPF0201 family)